MDIDLNGVVLAYDCIKNSNFVNTGVFICDKRCVGQMYMDSLSAIGSNMVVPKSSIGIEYCKDENEMIQYIRNAFSTAEYVLVEPVKVKH